MILGDLFESKSWNCIFYGEFCEEKKCPGNAAKIAKQGPLHLQKFLYNRYSINYLAPDIFRLTWNYSLQV